MLPLLIIGFAIAQGSGAIAGEEERGTLDILLSNPTTRLQVLLQKFAAMVTGILILGLVLWASVLIGAAIVDMDLSIVRAAEATLSGMFLGTAFGTLALALGSATGKRGLSTAAAGAVAVTAYFINALVPLAAMFGYVNTLRSMSQGRAQFTMHFDQYKVVPNQVSEEIQTRLAG